MHWNVEQILWALVFAGHLVVLIVLVGHNLNGRFPWFTAAISISTVHLLADHLLRSKLTSVAFYWQSYALSAIGSLLGILVLVELVRRVFASGKAGLVLKSKGWIGWAFVTIALAAAVLWALGPWPKWAALNAEPALLPLRLLWLGALKAEMLMGLLAVEIVVLLLLFGRRFGFRWTTQPVQIAVGLSTIAISQIAVQRIISSIEITMHPTTQEQYDRIVHLLTNLDNGRVAVWVLVLVWWIVWLWRDEPGAGNSTDPEPGLKLIPAGPLPGDNS